MNNANKLSICDDALKNKKKIKVRIFFHLGGISSNTWCASAAGSMSELAGASVAAAAVERPASFFPLVFVPPEPSAALFFFAEVLPFFGRAALGSFDGAAAARDGAGATPPVAVVIRGGKKRLRARPALGRAPAAGGRGCTAGRAGCRCVRPWVAPAPARARRGRRKGKSAARAVECAARCSRRPKYAARDGVSESAPNSV